jgi:hypothetical protein
LKVPASGNTSSNTRQGLRWLGRQAAIALLILAYAGLLIFLPTFGMMKSKNSTVEWSLGLCAVFFASSGLAGLATWWLRASLKPANDLFNYQTKIAKTEEEGVYAYSSNYDTGWKETRLGSYKIRGRQLCLMMALASYYVPAIVVVVHDHGWAALDPYLHSHLLDGFTFVALIAAGWALLARNETQAIRTLSRSTGIIALVSVYLAGGSQVEIAVAAFVTEYFGENFWRFIANFAVSKAKELEPPTSSDGTLQALIYDDQITTDRLEYGMRLSDPGCLISKNYQYKLVMCDGELAIWGPERDVRVWSSGTLGGDAAYAALQPDGVLCLYAKNGQGVLWQSGLPGGDARYVVITDEGALAAYRADDTRAWALTVPHPKHRRLQILIATKVKRRTS